MSNRETLDYDPVDALIEQGRRELADGKVEKAQWCFEEVLRRRPDEPRALLGLSYAARKSERPPASVEEEQGELGGAASVLSADVEVVVLVREKRYGEALAKLRAELSNRPDDVVLQRSITHLEKHIKRPSARPPSRTPAESPSAPDRLTPIPQAAVPQPQVPPEKKTPPEEAASAVLERPPSSPLTTRPSPAVEVDLSVTQPFELMKVVDTRRLSAERVETERAMEAQAESEARNQADADAESEALVSSGETRLTDLTASGGVRLADEDPSGPALGSLPPTPVPTAPKASGVTWWIFALLAVAALALALALRG